jgi:HK97 gp10 family phage protein
LAEIFISLGEHSKGSRKIRGFLTAFPANLQKGLNKAGAILKNDMTKKVSGPGRRRGSTHGPVSRLASYPGVVTGRLRGSINAQVSGVGNDLTLRAGPNVAYAPFLEFGTRKMQPYPFVGPTLDDKGDEAIRTIEDEIARPLGR